MRPKKHSRLRTHQRHRSMQRFLFRSWQPHDCAICELARADRRRAFAAGWDGQGSVAPFLVALDEVEARAL